MANTGSGKTVSPTTNRSALIPRPSLRSFTVFFLVLACLLVILGVFLYWEGLKIESRDRSDVTDRMFPYSVSLHTELTRRLGRVAGVAAFMKSNKSEPDYETMFQSFAEGLFTRELGMRNLQIVTGTTTNHIYPLEGNSQMIGMDWLKTTTGNNLKYLKEAIGSKKPTIIGPFDAHPGERVIAAVEPVNNPDGSLHGLAAAIYDYQIVISNIRLDQAANKLNVAVRTSDKTIVYGRASVFKDKPVIERVGVGDNYWDMAAIPKNGWAAQRNERLLPILLAGLAIVFLMAILISLGIERQRYLAGAIKRRTLELLVTNKDLKETMEKMDEVTRERDRTAKISSVLGEINEYIFKLKNVDEIFQRSCALMTDIGSYELCWIGLAKEDGAGLNVTAAAGARLDFLEQRTDDEKDILFGPINRAIEEGISFVCRDIEESDIPEKWKKKITEAGLALYGTFPIKRAGKPIGAIVVYSKDPAL